MRVQDAGARCGYFDRKRTKDAGVVNTGASTIEGVLVSVPASLPILALSAYADNLASHAASKILHHSVMRVLAAS
jgi:hypothetical protein